MNTKDNNILYQLHERMILAYPSDTIIVIKKKIYKIKYFDDFIPLFARKLIIKYHYIIIIRTKNIKLELYVDRKISEDKLQIIKIYLNLFYSNYIHKNKIQRIFYISFLKNKRLFDYNNDIILKDNVNGGATYKLNQLKHEIYIYREEEFERVFVHELIHTFELDEYLFDLDIDFYNKLFRKDILDTEILDIKPYLFEIFTQTLTILLISIRLDTKKLGTIDINNIKNIIVENRLHLLKICKKIQSKTKELKYYKEETSILSYYFGVCILLSDINIFIDFLNKHSYQIINELDFINDFKNLLIQNKKLFVKYLDNTELIDNFNTLVLTIFK